MMPSLASEAASRGSLPETGANSYPEHVSRITALVQVNIGVFGFADATRSATVKQSTWASIRAALSRYVHTSTHPRVHSYDAGRQSWRNLSKAIYCCDM